MNHDDPVSQHYEAADAVKAVESDPIESLRRLNVIFDKAAGNLRHPQAVRRAWSAARTFVLAELRKHDPNVR